MRADAGHRIDRDGDDLVRRVVRDLLDVHAAFGRDHDRDARGCAVDQHREIELLVDRRAFLDVEAVDRLPFGPVWCVTSVEPSMRVASFFTSSIDFTTLTPPALPRPPAWICAFTTQTGPPSSLRRLAPPPRRVNAGMPCGTGTPNSRSTALAWYSWMFIEASARRVPACADPGRYSLCRAPARSSGRPRPAPFTAATDLSNIVALGAGETRARRCARRPWRRSPPARRHRGPSRRTRR